MINEQRFFETFLELVKIYSPSGKEAPVRDFVIAKMQALGFAPVIDVAGNLFLKVLGVGEPFLLDAHFDTVEPAENITPQITDNKISSDGTTILGADDRVGIAIILEILNLISEKKLETRPLEILIAVQEETGGQGLDQFDFSQISAKLGLCLDTEGAGNITVASPFINTFNIKIIGRAAHAGVAPEKGINAIAAASQAISQIKWGRLDEETTCNIGVFSGGSVRNAVPELVTISAEARSHEKSKLDKLTVEIMEKFQNAAESFGAQIEIENKEALQGYKYSDDEPILAEFLVSAKNLGMEILKEKSGGGTDVNTLLLHGIRAAVIGVGYHEEHTKMEYLDKVEVLQSLGLVIEMIRQK